MVQSMMDAPAGVEQSYHAGEVGASASLLNWVGAILSLFLVAGLVTWGYKLAVRDVSGVPVVRAIEGPMRIQPDNPGGRVADHQGLAVNAVQSDGIAAAPADRLVLAPEPGKLTDEDQPRPTETAPAETAAENEVAPVTVPVPATEEDEPAIDPIEAAIRLATEGEEAIAPDESGLTRSIVPRRRPAVAQRTAPLGEATRASSAPTELAVTSVPSGTRMVYLGSRDTPDAARGLWDDLAQGSLRPLLANKRMIIEETTSVGKTLYRLRAMGFADLADARQFCSALLAERAECIPVVAR
ncbi:MAG: SPOR domain-containing protein [Pseudomonadota bacterium]